MEELGAPVALATCDIRDPEQIGAMFDTAESVFNNAAADFPVPSEDMSPNAWRSVIDITLNSRSSSRESSDAVTSPRTRRARS